MASVRMEAEVVAGGLETLCAFLAVHTVPLPLCA